MREMIFLIDSKQNFSGLHISDSYDADYLLS